MNILSLLWLSTIFFPLVLFLYSKPLDFNIASYTDIIILAISFLIILSGNLAHFIFYKMECKKKLEADTIMTAIGLTGAVAVYMASDNFLISAVAFVLYITGIKTYLAKTANIVSSSYLVVSAMCYIVVSFYYKSAILKIIFIAMIFMWLFLHNKKNVENLMASRKYDLKYMPKEIIKYNRILTLSICIICSVVFLFRKPFESLLSLLSNGFKKLIVQILTLITGKSDMGNINDELSEAQEIPKEELTEATRNPVFKYVLLFLTIAVLCIMLYRYHDILTSRLSSSIHSFIIKMRNFLGKKGFGIAIEKNTAYTDYFENVNEESIENNIRLNRRVRKWKKEYKKYNSMPDNLEKFRFGYGLILKWIHITNKNAKKSDTPLELAAKTNNNSFTLSTEAYCPVRYGEIEPDIDSHNKIRKTLEKCKEDSVNIK